MDLSTSASACKIFDELYTTERRYISDLQEVYDTYTVSTCGPYVWSVASQKKPHLVGFVNFRQLSVFFYLIFYFSDVFNES